MGAVVSGGAKQVSGPLRGYGSLPVYTSPVDGYDTSFALIQTMMDCFVTLPQGTSDAQWKWGLASQTELYVRLGL
uniref:Uncharacterized protein n=1 Tax=Setaria digitata TaxID=48799 RepID=A0A915PWU7_9BILA